MPTEVIRRISIQATQQGVAEATTGLNNLSVAQDGIVSSSEKMTKSQLSVANAYERQQRSLDIAYRSAQQFEKAQRTLDQALQQGIVTATRHAELSALNADKHGLLTKAANDNTAATSLNQAQLLELGHVAKATIEQIAAGAPAFRVLAQQGASTAQAMSLNPGGLGGTLRAVGASALAFLGPAGLVAAAIIAITVAAVALYEYLKTTGPTTEKLLTEHNRLLGVIKDSYDSLTGAASKWFQQSKDVTQLQLLQQEIDLRQKLQAEIGKTVSSLTTYGGLGDLFSGQRQIKEKFLPFEDALFKLNDGFKSGTPNVREFVDEIARISLLSPALQKIGNDLINSVGDASKLDYALKQIADAKKLISGARLGEDERGRLGLPDAPTQADPFQTQVNSISKHTATIMADTVAVGASVGEHARLRAEAQLLEVATRNGAKATGEQKQKIKEVSDAAGQAAQAFAQKNAQSQADFALQTVFLSDAEKQIAAVNYQLHGNNWKEFMNDGLSATIRLTEGLKTLKTAGTQFAETFIQGMLSGKSAADSLLASAKQLSNTLVSETIKNPTQGGPIGLVPTAIIAIGTALWDSYDKQKKQLEDAQAQWKKMTREVTAFNLAAAGVELGPLTSKLQSLFSNFQTLIDAAVKAQDKSGQIKLQNSFEAGLVRIVNEFTNGAQVLTPLQQSIKAVNDEATGLIATLNDLGQVGQDDRIRQALPGRIAALLSNYRDALTAGLTERLNAANNKAYLTDAAKIIKQHQADLSDAALLGNNPILLEQISATFKAEAQNVVNNAGLIGDAFADFQKQFPQLAGIVTQSTADIASAQKQLQDQLNGTAKTITDYVNGLFSGSGSTLSPTAQLAAAQSAYNAKLGLAQTGNASAQSTITQDAENLRQAARVVFASGSGYQAIFSQITSQLLALPAVQQTTDPVTQAVRDAITAISAGNTVLGTVATNTNTTATNTGSTGTIAQNTGGTMSGISGPGGTNALTTTQNATLASIQALNSTSTSQLNLLSAALAPTAVNQTFQVTLPNANLSTITLNNQVLLALNKIVFNTGSTASNTAIWPGTTSADYNGRTRGFTYAQGGFINGGIPGRDSVPLASGGLGMPGEFVVRNAVAQANASWLPMFNRTGMIPSNDNGSVVQRLDRLTAIVNTLLTQLATLTYEAGEKGAQATRSSIRELRDETRMRKRDQRAA